MGCNTSSSSGIEPPGANVDPSVFLSESDTSSVMKPIPAPVSTSVHHNAPPELVQSPSFVPPQSSTSMGDPMLAAAAKIDELWDPDRVAYAFLCSYVVRNTIAMQQLSTSSFRRFLSEEDDENEMKSLYEPGGWWLRAALKFFKSARKPNGNSVVQRGFYRLFSRTGDCAHYVFGFGSDLPRDHRQISPSEVSSYAVCILRQVSWDTRFSTTFPWVAQGLQPLWRVSLVTCVSPGDWEDFFFVDEKLIEQYVGAHNRTAEEIRREQRLNMGLSVAIPPVGSRREGFGGVVTRIDPSRPVDVSLKPELQKLFEWDGHLASWSTAVRLQAKPQAVHARLPATHQAACVAAVCLSHLIKREVNELLDLCTPDIREALKSARDNGPLSEAYQSLFEEDSDSWRHETLQGWYSAGAVVNCRRVRFRYGRCIDTGRLRRKRHDRLTPILATDSEPPSGSDLSEVLSRRNNSKVRIVLIAFVPVFPISDGKRMIKHEAEDSGMQEVKTDKGHIIRVGGVDPLQDPYHRTPEATPVPTANVNSASNVKYLRKSHGSNVISGSMAHIAATPVTPHDAETSWACLQLVSSLEWDAKSLPSDSIMSGVLHPSTPSHKPRARFWDCIQQGLPFLFDFRFFDMVAKSSRELSEMMELPAEPPNILDVYAEN